MRVLQVEDEPSTARIVEQMLRSDGHDCQTTPLGEEAVRLARDNDYDVILLDVMLPDIDGYEVLKRLVQAQVRTPVLIQSGLVQDACDKSAFGIDHCLVKPFGKDELRKSIAAVTATRTPATRTPATRTPATRTPAPVDPDALAEDRAWQERQRAPRTRIFKSGEIVYDDKKCVMDCFVLNISQGGAAIQPADMLKFPARFTLRVKFESTHDCEIRWQYGNKLGVLFVDT